MPALRVRRTPRVQPASASACSARRTPSTTRSARKATFSSPAELYPQRSPSSRDIAAACAAAARSLAALAGPGEPSRGFPEYLARCWAVWLALPCTRRAPVAAARPGGWQSSPKRCAGHRLRSPRGPDGTGPVHARNGRWPDAKHHRPNLCRRGGHRASVKPTPCSEVLSRSAVVVLVWRPVRGRPARRHPFGLSPVVDHDAGGHRGPRRQFT